MPKVLSGLKILITRPQHQAEHLNQLITQAGGETFLLPVLAIAAIPVSFAPGEFDEYQWIIFTSANAVTYGLPPLVPLPPQLNVASIGKKTELALRQHLPLHCIVTAPPPYHSESFLTLAQFQQVTDLKIALFKGEGGREVLAETLRQRGAWVKTVAVYRRVQPIQEVAWLAHVGEIDAIVVTSSESLYNLFNMLADFAWLPHTPLILISERMADTARHLGSTAALWIAPEASDAGLLQAACDYAASRELPMVI